MMMPPEPAPMEQGYSGDYGGDDKGGGQEPRRMIGKYALGETLGKGAEGK